MKRFVPAILAILALVAGLSISSPNTASGQTAGLVSSVLSRMENNRRSLTSLRAGLSMEKYNSQLRFSDHYDGTVIYVPSGKREASVRVEWSKPRKEILAVANGKWVLFRPALKQAMVGTSRSVRGPSAAGGILDLMYMSRQQLEARFHPVQDVRQETLWGGVETIHLTLVPKGNVNFKYAEIWVDNSGMPVQTKIVEKNDDATTMRLRNLVKNDKIDSREFELSLDSDIKVVKA